MHFPKLGRQYAGLPNTGPGRTGSLCEGRYKSCLVVRIYLQQQRVLGPSA